MANVSITKSGIFDNVNDLDVELQGNETFGSRFIGIGTQKEPDPPNPDIETSTYWFSSIEAGDEDELDIVLAAYVDIVRNEVEYVQYKIQTIGTTAKELMRVLILEDCVYFIMVRVVGKKDDFTDRGAYEKKVLWYNVGSGAVQQGTVVTDFSRESVVGYNVAFVGDGDYCSIQVDGVDGDTVDWEGHFQVDMV